MSVKTTKKGWEKLEEFPKDFDNTYFIGRTVSKRKSISILRHIVYRKIKNTIDERVDSYDKNKDIDIDDKFTVEFKMEDYKDYAQFDWAVIRAELLDCGYDAKLVFEPIKDEDVRKDNTVVRKFQSLVVPIERTINLLETLDDREQEFEEEIAKHITKE